MFLFLFFINSQFLNITYKIGWDLNAVIQTTDVEILVSQADGGVTVEIVGWAPIEDQACVIPKLPEGE